MNTPFRSRVGVLVNWEPNTQSGLVARISDSTVWRWLHTVSNALGNTAWIFPRDADFAVKAGRILSL